MYQIPVIGYFAKIFRYTTFMDYRRATLSKPFQSWRVFMILAILFLTTYEILDEAKLSFSKVHDTLFFSVFCLTLEICLVMKRKQVSELVEFILEPIPNLLSSRYFTSHQLFLTILKVCAFFSVFDYFYFGIVWPLQPMLIAKAGYSDVIVDLPLAWMMDSESSWKSLCFTVFLISFMLLEDLLFESWFLTMTFSVLKLKLLSEVLTADLANMDETAEENCENFLNSSVRDGKIPLCRECMEFQVDPVTRRRKVRFCNAPSLCCRKQYREKILPWFYEETLHSLIAQHQRIIKLSLLVDDTFRMSLLTFTQTAVIINALVIPRVDTFTGRSVLENLPALMEVMGALKMVGIFSVCGQMLYDQSYRIRFAFYSCKWYNKSASFTRCLLVAQTVANKNLRLTAGGLYVIKLEQFITFLLSVYSYLKVMQWLKYRSTSG